MRPYLYHKVKMLDYELWPTIRNFYVWQKCSSYNFKIARGHLFFRGFWNKNISSMTGHKSCIPLTIRMTFLQVILEMCFLNKTCFTIFTWKWLFSSMSHNVCRKVTLSIEIFSANVTWKWFSSCMGQNMILHISEHMHYSRAKWAAIFSRSKSNGIFFMIFLDFFGSIWFTSCIRTDFGPICVYHLNEQFMKSWKT